MSTGRHGGPSRTYLGLVLVILATTLLQLWLSLQVDLSSSSSSSSSLASARTWQKYSSSSRAKETRNSPKVAHVILPQDRHCIFRDSPLYRSVFVYPSPGEPEWNKWRDQILSETGKSWNAETHRYPWQSIEERTRRNGEYHFRMRDARAIQYTTELLVREILTHPDSCLRTHDANQANLFFVPYMVSMEWHNGTQYPKSFETSPYGQAIIDILDQTDQDQEHAQERKDHQYTKWENVWGLSSTFWKRRGGADHVLVMSESCHGLSHPRGQCSGHNVLLRAQKQMSPAIIVTIVTSRTFVRMYPQCAAKNIVVPNPNPDGRWFNGRIDRMAAVIAHNASFETSPAALSNDPSHRPLAYYYNAGNHGSCRRLRQQLETTFECSRTGQYLRQQLQAKRLPKGYHFPHAFRHATFCPCPGGDAPNAKRYFDAIMAGCIPLILSADFVWPYSSDIPGSRALIYESDISIRLTSADFTPEGTDDPQDRPKICPKVPIASSSNNNNKTQTIQSFLESISTSEIERLQQNLPQAAAVYSYYEYSPDLPDNPLRERILPNGRAAHAFVQALADRALGVRWPACHKEVQEKDPLHTDSVHQYQC